MRPKPKTAAERWLATQLATCDAMGRETGDLRQQGYTYLVCTAVLQLEAKPSLVVKRCLGRRPRSLSLQRLLLLDVLT